MDLNLLQQSLNEFQSELFKAITSKTYNGAFYANGQKAKEAAIRSQTLIFKLHESVKKSFSATLKRVSNKTWQVFPPIDTTNPELKIYGKLKGKDQDLVFLNQPLKNTIIEDGPNAGSTDTVGAEATSSSIVISIRSQMSSVAKNFDTLMERAFAETINLRMRTPKLVMAEVYLIPIQELDDNAMERQEIQFKPRPIDVSKFIKIFDSMSHRKDIQMEEQFKYDASALIIIDLKQKPVKIITNGKMLKEYGVEEKIADIYDSICAENFDSRLIAAYEKIHSNHS